MHCPKRADYRELRCNLSACVCLEALSKGGGNLSCWSCSWSPFLQVMQIPNRGTAKSRATT